MCMHGTVHKFPTLHLQQQLLCFPAPRHVLTALHVIRKGLDAVAGWLEEVDVRELAPSVLRWHNITIFKAPPPQLSIPG